MLFGVVVFGTSVGMPSHCGVSVVINAKSTTNHIETSPAHTKRYSNLPETICGEILRDPITVYPNAEVCHTFNSEH